MFKMFRNELTTFILFCLIFIFIGIFETTNAQNSAPTCPSVIVSLDVDENTAAGTNIHNLTCTDVDSGANGTLSYAITSGNGGSEFQITEVSGNGELDIIVSPDYEALWPSVSPAYSLVVTVSDGGSPSLTYDVTVDVNIIGINENDPAFSVTSPVNIAEDHAVTTSVVDTNPSDADSGVDGEFTTEILSQTPGTNVFIIDPPTGQIKLRKSLDYESVTSYTVKVQVTDNGSPARSTTADITIQITDVNDNAPDCGTTTQFYVTAVEDWVANDLIQALTCTDAESGTTLTYAISTGDTTKFKVNTDGTVRINTPIDVDTEATDWPLTIDIVDSGTPQLTSTVTVDVTVEGIDDNQPVWSAPESGTYSVSVDENSAIGTVVATIAATDTDTAGTTDSQITYGIETATTQFSIEPLTGQIYVAGGIDRETTTSFSLSISAYSSNQTTNKILGTVTITVHDLNDITPTFGQDLYTVTLAENTVVSTTALTVAATDTDSGTNAQIVYSISSGTTPSGCGHTIDANTGDIVLGESLNYETATTCTLTVVATDSGTSALSSSATAIIVVTPINEATPAFGGPYSFNVAEDAASGTTIGTVSAADTDAGDDGIVAYSLNTHTSEFVMEPNTGVLVLDTTLDRETTASYNVEVLAIDQSTTTKLTGTVTVTVTVTDANDNSPLFTQDLYTVTLVENTAASTTALTVAAADTDSGTNGQILYSISSGTTPSGCGHTIDANTGDIVLGESLNYETSTTCTLTVVATDSGTSALSSSATAIIVVTPINEVTPTFGGPYSFSVAEDAAIGTTLGTVSAADTDVGDDGIVVYSLNTHTSEFVMEPNTGVLVLNTALDRETTASYNVEVLAIDQSTTTKLTGTVTVTVTVTDVNDNNPLFTQYVYTVSSAENTATSTTVLTVAATDSDTGVNAQITYSISSGTAPSGCGHTIDANGGGIVLGESLNYETSTTCTLTVVATDGGTPALSSTAVAIIIVTPINEVTPTFGGPYTFTVAEDASPGTSLGTVSASDTDAGDDGVVVYSLNTHADKFVVESNTGILLLATTTLDRETTASYNVEVLAIDQSSTTQLTGTVTVTVTVTDVNDNGPLCVDVEYVSLTSSVTVGDTVYTGNCSDADDGVNGALTYSILSGNTNTDFSLSTAGVLSVLNSLSQVEYTINILVSDQGTPAKTASIYAIIYVAIVPVFNSFPSTLTVNEAETFGTTLVTFSATASSGFKTFQIVSGNTENKFKINKYLGGLYLINTLDRETTASYSLVIRVTDSVTGLTQDDTITITVDDANDNTPTFASSFYQRLIVETIFPPLTVVSLPATDNDINQNAAITYAIADGNAEGKFAIDSSTGALLLVNTLDAETTPFYTLTVTATDNGSPKLTGTTVVLIEVFNADEYLPQFLAVGQTYNHNLDEDTAVGANIYTVTATDPDAGTDFTYFITAGNTGNAFVMDSSLGEIYLSNYLDRETLDAYVLTLEADNGMGSTATGTLSITVNDINDNDPTFDQDVYSNSILESTAIGVSVSEVNCTDIDLGVNAVFSLSIVGGNTASAFRLDGSLVEVNAVLDYETVNKYVLLIQALDTGTPARSSTSTVLITILPLYSQPTFASVTQSFTISENTALGTTIYDMDATLAGCIEGVSGDVYYTLQSGDTLGQFSVNVFTGEVTVIGSLDREVTPSYNLYFIAENRLDPSKRDSVTLMITVDDVNDNYPLFTSSSYLFFTDEGVTVGTSIGTVTAQDADTGTNAAVSYAIIAGEGMTEFSVDPISGQISTSAAMNASVKDSYLIVVQSSDGAVPSKTIAVDVVITVNDLNDNVPAFGQTYYNIQVTESASIGTVLYQFTAQDADLGTNAVIAYVITSGNGDSKFRFGALTGNLELANNIDRETVDSYVIVVEAYDAGTPSLTGTATVVINVTDVNDNTPNFATSLYPVTVPRTSAVGTSLAQVAASDLDSGTNGEFEFYIMSGNTDSLFIMNYTTGIVTTAGELTAAGDTYNLTCHSVDNGYPKLTSTATIAIIVDPPLVAINSDYSFSVSEDIPVLTFIGQISPDAIHPSNASIEYAIIGGNFGNDMNISIVNGNISNVNTLDREVNSDYYITVTLQDINNPISYNKLVHITLTDVNDNTPNFSLGSGAGPTNISIIENSPIGSSVHTVSAVDLDDGVNGQFTYEISNSNPAAPDMFNIGNTGIITLKSSPDYELIRSIAFEVLAKDGGSPQRTGTTTITAYIVDINDSNLGSSAFFSLECSSEAVNDDVIVTMTPTNFGLTVASDDTIQYITMNDKGVFNVKTTGDFYVQKQQYVYSLSRYYMWVAIRVTDVSNNVTATSGLVRVDTFIPNDNLVILGHNVSQTAIENQEGALIYELGKLFCSICRVGIWKIRGTTSTARRRLLADSSESLVYVVSDTSTDSMSGLESDKSFLTQSEILQVLQKSSDGTPSSSLNTASFATFPITSVNSYTESSTSSGNWAQSTEGIAVLSTIGAGLFLLASILIIYFLCTRERKFNLPSDEEHLTKKDKRTFEDTNAEKPPSKKEKLNAAYTHPDADAALAKAKIATKPENVKALPKVPNVTNQKQNVRVSLMESKSHDDLDPLDHTRTCNRRKRTVVKTINVNTCNKNINENKNEHYVVSKDITDISKISNFGENKRISAKEHWDILLEKAGFGLQSLRRISRLSKFKNVSFDRNKISNFDKNKQSTNSGEHECYSSADDFESELNCGNLNNEHSTRVTPKFPDKALTTITSERSSAEKACLAKDPLYIGWAKIIGRRLRANFLEKRNQRLHSEMEMKIERTTTSDSGIVTDASFDDEIV